MHGATRQSTGTSGPGTTLYDTVMAGACLPRSDTEQHRAEPRESSDRQRVFSEHHRARYMYSVSLMVFLRAFSFL